MMGAIDLSAAMGEAAQDIAAELERLLPSQGGLEDRLFEAMRYATLNGGKRLRPFLAIESAKLFGVSRTAALRAGAAVEMIHCYSLVHDDLPAMDDDDLRRGMPTTHRQFDEATAILAGDALLTLAFEVLADERTHGDPAVRAQLVLAVAKASGAHGMVGGQMIDLQAEKHATPFDQVQITRLQQMKTGALIAVSCEIGPILAKASPQARHALHAYAHDLGLAFQIVDDLLDHEGTEEEVGKKVGKDADAGKATFVSILGADNARRQADILAEQACRHLDMFEEKAEMLKAVARFVVERRT